MTRPDRARLLERVAVEVADLAAAYVRAQAGSATEAGIKTSPTDVVTRTDLGSERLIRDELAARCPGSAVVGEEYDDTAGANNVGWVVDPIDGTVNFLYDLPVVSVSIAATIDGRVVAGAVADIHRGDTYSACDGGGARRLGQSVTTSSTSDLAQALVGTGFSYDATVRAEEAAMLMRTLPACRDVRCMGSAALNLCWVADGRLDAFYERDLKVYDYAAGALIAAEAGARVQTPDPANHGLLIAAVDRVFEPLCSVVGDVTGS